MGLTTTEEILSGKVQDSARVTLAGIVDNLKVRQLKNGNILASAFIEDMYSSIGITIFSKAYDTKKFAERTIGQQYFNDIQDHTVSFISDLKNHLAKVEVVGAENPGLNIVGNKEKMTLLKRLSKAFSSFRRAFRD
jgi:DNA polymerase III alpha subunit